MSNQPKPSPREKLRTPQEKIDIRMEILESLWQKLQTLREDNLTEAENKLQLTAYLTIAEEMFKALMTFTNAIESDIKSLKEEQMNLLSLQKEYIKTSGNEIERLVFRTYDDIKEQYAVLIENALKEATANHNRSMKAMERVADKCTETAKSTGEQCRALPCG